MALNSQFSCLCLSSTPCSLFIELKEQWGFLSLSTCHLQQLQQCLSLLKWLPWVQEGDHISGIWAGNSSSFLLGKTPLLMQPKTTECLDIFSVLVFGGSHFHCQLMFSSVLGETHKSESAKSNTVRCQTTAACWGRPAVTQRFTFFLGEQWLPTLADPLLCRM